MGTTEELKNQQECITRNEIKGEGEEEFRHTGVDVDVDVDEDVTSRGRCVPRP